ncbi:MAG: ferrous iron transport protein A [Clostridia bacterium]|nr:ferrous iron transport protein A [Clostridia bacterium]
MDRLTEIRKNVFARIEKVDESAPLKIKRRLLELGFTKGQKIRVVEKSLSKQTFLVELRGYCLSMRKNLASYIVVE